MARIGEILEVIRTETDQGVPSTDLKIDFGGGNICNAVLYATPGDDSLPLVGEYALVVDAGGRGAWVAIGTMDPALVASAAQGERILSSRTALGELAAWIHLKSDGTTEVNGSDFVALASLVADELARINDDFTSLKSAIGTGFTNVGAAMAANGALGKAAFDTAASAVPSTPGSVASTRLKTE